VPESVDRSNPSVPGDRVPAVYSTGPSRPSQSTRYTPNSSWSMIANQKFGIDNPKKAAPVAA
jgi:hypothetical protein